jgi:hypothetical protein
MDLTVQDTQIEKMDRYFLIDNAMIVGEHYTALGLVRWCHRSGGWLPVFAVL